MKATLILAFLLFAGALHAAPPLDYDAAVAWTDATVKTSIPKGERIYVLGPETKTESYILDGKPATHAVAVRQIVSAKKVDALGDLGLNRFGKIPLTILVYQAANPGMPIFTTANSRSSYLLKAGDLVVVRIERPTPPGMPPPVS